MLTRPEMIKNPPLLALLFATCFALLLPVASTTGAQEAETREPPGKVEIRRKQVVTVLTRFGRSTPKQRAEHAMSILRPLARLDSPSEVRADRDKSGWSVRAGDTLVLRATPAEAKAHGTSPEQLATLWAAAINRVLAIPAVSLSAEELLVPVGEKRTLTIDGETSAGFRVETSGAGKVIRLERRGSSLTVWGISAGSAEILIRTARKSRSKPATCVVRVMKAAGSLPSNAIAEVTGSPATEQLCDDAAAFALRRTTTAEPGAVVTVVRPPRGGRALVPGESFTVTARVRIQCENCVPVEGDATVIVRNASLPPREARLLLYSNNPERITLPGLLFAGPVEGDAPVRLFYHHVNNLEEPVALSVRLINPGDAPAAVQLVPGFTLPDPDPIRAGHKAGRAFFQSYRQNLGEIFSIPARSSLLLRVDRLRPGDTGSGVAEIRLVDPGRSRCLVRVAADPWAGVELDPSLAQSLDAWRWAAPRPASQAERAEPPASPHVYPFPIKKIQARYAAGGNWTWVRIGKEPVRGANGTQRLEGNYGVLYRIAVELHNPSAEQKKVEVVFDAGAGPANGVFLVDEKYVDLTGAYSGAERQVVQFDLAPNESRIVTIETMPLGGGFYPASLVIRAAGAGSSP
jgi:hypothetical protein